MELHRILARDTRSATESAIALHGPDVLVISNQRVGHQTELIVAVDMAQAQQDAGLPQQPERDMVLHQANSDTARQAKPMADFGQALQDSLKQSVAVLAQSAAAQPDAPRLAQSEPPADPQYTVAPRPSAPSPERIEPTWEASRSQELVALVREEIQALRQEFKLGQQLSPWQDSLPMAASIKPVVQHLHDAGVPAALKAMLIDRIRELGDAEAAYHAMRDFLLSVMPPVGHPMAQHGSHLIFGPSGAGKTLMTLKLATAAAQRHGHSQVAVVSLADGKTGAWGQFQLLAAQAGIDCFRASDTATLTLIQEDLQSRQAIFIDTPGVAFERQLGELTQQLPGAQCHAVLPADASIASVKRVSQAHRWDSLMVSKLDETCPPWPLLQHLVEHPDTVLTALNRSDRLGQSVMGYDAIGLVDLALSPVRALAGAGSIGANGPTAEVLRQRGSSFRNLHG